MANARSSDVLCQVRTLFGVGAVAGLSDAQLLERFVARSASAGEAALAAEAAFEALVARHGPMVLGVCRRALSDPGEVEDAFQATFLVLVRRAGSVRAGDSLGRWLYGVARRVAAKASSRSERSRARSARFAGEPAAPDSAADRIGLLEALDEEVSRLPAKYRDPIILCHLDGLTHAEAAARLRWPVGTVSGRLSRARGLLRDRLVRRGLAPTVGSMGILLATEGARTVVPDHLTAVTARAATRLSMGRASQVGAASSSALSLMDEVLREVLRAAVAVKLKAAVAILLALAFAGAAVATAGVEAGALAGPAPAGPPPDGEPGVDTKPTLRPAGDGGPRPRPWPVRATFEAHADEVNAVAFSPDGKVLAAGYGDSPPTASGVKLWDTATGQELGTLNGHRSWVWALAFSPDGTTLATASADRTTKLWDVTTRRVLATLPGHTSGVRCLAFAPDGKMLATGSQDMTIKLWDVETRQESATLWGHRTLLVSVAFSPDGTTLASGGWTDIKLWDVATRRERAAVEVRGPAASRLAFSPDGKSLLSAAGQVIKLWEVATGRERATFGAYKRPIAHADLMFAVAFAPDGRTFATGGEDGTVRVRDAATGQERVVLRHDGRVQAVAFSPDGRALASGSSVSTVRLWEATGPGAGRRAGGVGLAPDELEALWADLAGEDAARAYRAIVRLASSPEQAVPYLRRRLPPVPGLEPSQVRRIPRLLAALDHDTFAVRERAARELGQMGEPVVPALRRALGGRLSAEAHWRVEQLLGQLQASHPTTRTLRASRAVEVLERSGTPAARVVLDAWSEGSPEALLTQEAKAALGRLTRQDPAAPCPRSLDPARDPRGERL